MKWDFHPEALAEFDASAAYYADIDPELQLRFIEAIEAAIDQVLAAPTRWRMIDDEVRRYIVHVFPFGILYTVEDEFLLIVAVMHFSREPEYWKDRIS
jgi:plasmid stabilization system protein ParE